jgi:hypothetical protein
MVRALEFLIASIPCTWVNFKWLIDQQVEAESQYRGLHKGIDADNPGSGSLASCLLCLQSVPLVHTVCTGA